MDALAQIGNVTNPTWNMNFKFTYPLGMAAAKANYARALLLLDQSQATLKAQELTVSSDVTNAGLAVENTYKQYQAAQKNARGVGAEFRGRADALRRRHVDQLQRRAGAEQPHDGATERTSGRSSAI